MRRVQTRRRPEGKGRGEEKKVFAEVVLDESKPPSVFSARSVLIARFIRATTEKPFLDRVPAFLLLSPLPFVPSLYY